MSNDLSRKTDRPALEGPHPRRPVERPSRKRPENPAVGLAEVTADPQVGKSRVDEERHELSRAEQLGLCVHSYGITSVNIYGK